MRFTDEATVVVIAGSGGSGSVHWRREKFVPRGGPDGGDGGRGGTVVFRAEPGLNTLIDFALSPTLRAENGGNGAENLRTGRDGSNAVFDVPVGTQVFFEEKLVADLSQPGARWIAARGGNGGRGNAFFKSATNQAPDYAQPGTPGEQFTFRLELKSVADVGLVGFPNVGKSTLISKISKASPKIADYPFTTLRPNLGVVLLDDARRFVVADIPGLIPGAHEGRGLGIRFLKHIERTYVLAQLIDVTLSFADTASESSTPANEQLLNVAITQFEAIDKELKAFSDELGRADRLVVFSKGDLDVSRAAFEVTAPELQRRGFTTLLISSVTGEGIKKMCEILNGMLHK